MRDLTDFDMWNEWVRGKGIPLSDQEVLEETMRFREEQDRIEQRVSRPSSRAASRKRPSESRVGGGV